MSSGCFVVLLIETNKQNASRAIILSTRFAATKVCADVLKIKMAMVNVDLVLSPNVSTKSYYEYI